ncbi:MAG TPA: hypothetical protein VNM40_02195 [Candidatus Paceibacterota bacterium]|nr:hypothetical protein [Candidatus Paceibacterota bacterium]
MRRRVILSLLLALLVGGFLLTAALLGMGEGGTERLGFIDGVTTNGNYGVIFDEAEWLTGAEGEDAAIEAGLCTEATRSSCLPNDYIIRNTSGATRVYEFANDVVITMQTLRMEQEGVRPTVISRQEFEQLINNPSQHWRDLPYRITIHNGLVRKVDEVYVP